MNGYCKEEINALLVRIKMDAYDKLAFDELYKSMESPIFFIAKQYMDTFVGSKGYCFADLEDIVANTFVVILEKIDKFRYVKNGSAWIFKITENLCRKIYKKNRKLKFSDFSDISSATSFEVDILNRINLGNILRCLTNEERSIIILRELFGFTYKEIAVLLKISLPTVNRRLKTIRDRFQVYNE